MSLWRNAVTGRASSAADLFSAKVTGDAKYVAESCSCPAYCTRAQQAQRPHSRADPP